MALLVPQSHAGFVCAAVSLTDLLQGGFPAEELRAAGFAPSEIRSVLSPAERLQAAQTCHELVPNAAQPSEAETLAGFLNHSLLYVPAVDSLLTSKGAVAELMRIAADPATPPKHR